MAPRAAAENVRFYEMDALRASAMFLGIIYHTLFTFTVALNGAYLCWDRSAHPVADWIAAALHGFRMELFYVIGGFFGALVYRRYGLLGFIRNRGGRILRPFLISAALFVVVLHFLSLYAVAMRTAPSWWPTGWRVMPAYLWFLFYMVMMDVCSIGLILLGHVVPLQGALTGADKAMRWVVQFRPRAFLLAIPTALLLATKPALPFFDYVPRPVWLAYYGTFFAFGWFLHRQYELRAIFAETKWTNAALAAIVFAPAHWLEGRGGSPPVQLAAHYLSSLYAWSLVLAMMGLFIQYVSKPSWRFRYLADSSYWTYLIHWPILTFLQISLALRPLPGVCKVALMIAIVEAAALLTYRYLVRYTFIGNALNGPRARNGEPAHALAVKPGSS
jgi:glucan biosynthesis protein C